MKETVTCWSIVALEKIYLWDPDLIGYIHRQREGSSIDLGLLRRKNPQAERAACKKV